MDYLSKIFGAIASGIAIIFVFYSTTQSLSQNFLAEYEHKSTLNEKIKNSELEIDALRKKLQNITSITDAIKSDNGEFVVAAKINDIKSETVAFNNRLSAIEAAVSTNPEKLLTISLLEKDLSMLKEKLTDLKDSQRSQFASLSSRVDAIIYGILAVSLAVLGLSLPSIIKHKKTNLET